jgi:hypothetical protein
MAALEHAHVEAVRLGAVTSVGVDEATVRADYKSAAFKKNLGRAALGATLMLAGGVAAGSVGGEAATNRYIVATTSQPGAGMGTEGVQTAVAALSEAEQEILIEKQMQQRLPQLVRQRLERDAAANPLVKSKIKPTAAAHLEVHLDAIYHDHKHGEHFLVADASAHLLSASGQCLYEMWATGCSYRGDGRPQTTPAKSAAELLSTPGILERHLDSVAGGITESFTQELAEVFESLDPANQ